MIMNFMHMWFANWGVSRKLAITKTSGNLGISNAKALGIVWRDRKSKNSKEKCRTTTIVAVCAAGSTTIVLPRHFCLLA